MRDRFDLSNRVAVVIGSSSGLGRAIAVGLAEHGADVVPAGRRQSQLDDVCREVELAGGRTLACTADVTDRESVDRLRDAVLDRFGRVDILVNAAGFTFKRPTAEICDQQWSKIVDTNL